MERRSQKERIELSDRLMMDATAALIREVGTAATSLKDVGERAGYSRGLAKVRFGSKDALFGRLIERYRRTWIEEMRRVAGDKKGLELLRARIDAIVSYVNSYPHEARVLYILWFESVGLPSPLRSDLAEFLREARRDIAVIIEDAISAGEVDASVDAGQFAVHFTSVFFGTCYQWVVEPESISIEAVLGATQVHFLRVLGVDR